MRELVHQLYLKCERNPYYLVAIVSLLFSLLAVITRDLINSDGTVFLTYAEMISQGRIDHVLSEYPYPLFSLLISSLSVFLLGNIQLAADVLLAFLWMIAGVSFVGILKSLGSSPKTVMIGLIAFLLFPVLNEIRADVYRDPGYIAFGLASIWMFFKFRSQNHQLFLVLSLISATLATLFRIEGCVLLVLPLILFMLHGKNNYIRLSLFLVVGISIVVSSIFLKDFKGDVPLIVSPASTALSTIDESILERIELTKSEVLNKHSEKYALGFFLFGSLYLLIIPIINNLKLFFIYALFNLSKKAKYELDSEVWWILGLVSIPLLIQVLYAGFLQARYAVFISVIILAALVLTYRESLLPKKQLSKSLAIVFLFILFVDGLISMGASREYRVDTVEWVHENVLDTDFVISNERTVSYSMQHLKKLEHGIIDDPGCNIIQNYDYYVHGSGKRKKDLPNCVKNQEMVTAFQNKKGHSLQVYKMTKTEQ
jgi:hypothetical protein